MSTTFKIFKTGSICIEIISFLNGNHKIVTDKLKEKLNINSQLVQYLYNFAYDERSGNSESWIYPKQNEILISNLSEEAKLALVYHNLSISSSFGAVNG